MSRMYVTDMEVFLALLKMKEVPHGAENENCPPKK